MTRDLPIVAVVGATAAGKSVLALELALRLGGEVVNTDAMQLYRGMDIGTAKLTPAERHGVPHHLIDVWAVDHEASVAEFQAMARAAIAECRDRGVVPVLVGGSALYTRAVVDRLDFPGTDPEVRRRLEAELEELGPEVLHARLATLDAEAAVAIEPRNGRRIVRALEVIELTGAPFIARLPTPSYLDPHTVQIGLAIPRPVLDHRIATRVEAMWEAGLVAETESLGVPLRESRTASRALGYAQVLAFLAGECTEREAHERTVVGTRRFARRQEAWFGKDPRVSWIPHDEPDIVEQALAAIDRARVSDAGPTR